MKLDLANLIGSDFEDKCPVCGNIKLSGGEHVYWEDGSKMWDYYKWYCPKCETVILEEIETDAGTCINALGQEVGYDDLCVCPRCRNEVDWDYDHDWDTEGGINVDVLQYDCPRCRTKFEGKVYYDVSEKYIFALKDKNGNIAKLSNVLGEGTTGLWTGAYTENYL